MFNMTSHGIVHLYSVATFTVEVFQQEPTVQTVFKYWLWKAGTLTWNKCLLTDNYWHLTNGFIHVVNESDKQTNFIWLPTVGWNWPMTDENLYTSLSVNTIIAKLTSHFQGTRLNTINHLFRLSKCQSLKTLSSTLNPGLERILLRPEFFSGLNFTTA